MKKSILAAVAIILTPLAAFSQSQDGPTTSDLGFLIGTWKINAVHYDVSNPEDPGRKETGTKACRYALESAFVVCENNSFYKGEDKEFPEAYIEYVNYNPYVEAFEKTNFFSSFPVKVIERVTFDDATRVVEIRGRVEVENNVDSYVEYWRFNEEFTAFDREAMINRSSMPLTEYRLILSGRGTRVDE